MPPLPFIICGLKLDAIWIDCFSIHRRSLPEFIITLGLQGLSHFILTSTFINCHSSIKRSFPFILFLLCIFFSLSSRALSPPPRLYLPPHPYLLPLLQITTASWISYIFNVLQSVTFFILFDVQMVPNVARGRPFKMDPISFL